jgi:hypothetical protein
MGLQMFSFLGTCDFELKTPLINAFWIPAAAKTGAKSLKTLKSYRISPFWQ